VEGEQLAAERIFYATSPAGILREVTLTVLMPTPRSGGGWRAPVCLKGLDDRVHNIAGMDSWQALSLAMRFAGARVGHFVESGWKFSWGLDGNEISPKDF
jgi:hypothetical protein